MKEGLRGRQSGVDLKPPRAAVVKSDGGERCGNDGPSSHALHLAAEPGVIGDRLLKERARAAFLSLDITLAKAMRE